MNNTNYEILQLIQNHYRYQNNALSAVFISQFSFILINYFLELWIYIFTPSREKYVFNCKLENRIYIT